MIEIKEKSQCCGCTACSSICPKKAIVMKQDEEGFMYPIIDKSKCVNCGLCDKVCPVKNVKEEEFEQKAYIVNNKDDEIRKDSTSGGAFTPIAEYVLNRGGVVFGAAFDKNYNVAHTYVDNKENLTILRGSKYVQSFLGDTFKQVKDFLNDNRMVCFSGTPCQIEGLKKFLQKDYKNLQGRSAVLDCVAKDSEGKQIDIEIQQDNEGASPKRARYHSGLIDMNTLEPGQDFDKLPESYIIFITKKDILGQNLPIYHIDRKIRETHDYFNDESHIIYVNSKIQDDTELGRLMHDFNCKNPKNMYNKILANRVSELKETTKGVDTMSHEMEQLFKELCKEEIKENTLSMSVEMAANMAADGIPTEKIAQYLKVDTTTVKKWLDKKN